MSTKLICFCHPFWWSTRRVWTLISYLVYLPGSIPKLNLINSVVEVVGVNPWYLLSEFHDGSLPHVECLINIFHRTLYFNKMVVCKVKFQP